MSTKEKVNLEDILKRNFISPELSDASAGLEPVAITYMSTGLMGDCYVTAPALYDKKSNQAIVIVRDQSGEHAAALQCVTPRLVSRLSSRADLDKWYADEKKKLQVDMFNRLSDIVLMELNMLDLVGENQKANLLRATP